MNRKRLAAWVMAAGCWGLTHGSAVAEEKDAEETLDAKSMDTIVVTATRTETPVDQLGQSVTVIDRSQIEATQLTNVSDLLRQVVGIDFRSNGPHSSTSNVGIRGLSGYHTKVLVNGIPLQDTAGVQQMPVINDINVNDIERIEVVRGPSSTVYGSNALGGVINIITRRGKTKGFKGNVGGEYGSHGRIRTHASGRGVVGKVDYSLSLLREVERGISAQDTPLNGDDDSWRNMQAEGTIGIQLDEHFRLEFFGRYSTSDEEYDMANAVWGPYVDSGDIHNQRWMTGLRLAGTDLWNGLLDTSLSASYSELMRGYRDDSGWSWNDRYTGETRQINWQNTLHLHERVDLTFGIDRTRDSAEVDDGGVPSWGIPPSVPVDDRQRTTAVFAALQVEPVDNLFLNGGVRWNDNSEFDSEWTYTAAAAYLIESTGTRLKASVGKSYRAPSLYELYEPTYGMPDLQPETGTAWDVGFEQDVMDDKVTFGSTYFSNRVTDYIGFNLATYRYDQVSGIKTSGLESFVRLRPIENLSLQLTHTYQHTNSMEEEASPLAFRPRHKGSADLTWQPNGGPVRFNLNGLYVGHQNTLDGGGEHLDAYTLINAAITYTMNEFVEFYVRTENLLNENYEVAPNYNEYGRVYYVGTNISF